MRGFSVRDSPRSPQSKILSETAAYCTFALIIVAAVYVFGSMNSIWGTLWEKWSVVYCLKTGIEVIASCFAIFYLLVALAYRKPVTSHRRSDPKQFYPEVAVVYLCCDDLERRALQSIVASCAKYHPRLVVHDDSASRQNRVEVDTVVRELQEKFSQPIQVIRRPNRVGGKPGAINNVIRYLAPDIEFLLLCDSDSFLPDMNFLEEALASFAAPEVALVQFRNVGHTFAEDGSGYKVLSMSVDFYDAFVSFMDRFGWSPFLGHNALLRVSAFKEVGGFTPGQLADDIDYSVALRLKGYQIRYAREIAAGERHPLTYEALRTRTQKWTYGCTQVLSRWSWAVLRSTKLSPFDKANFFLTVGYYHFQLLLLAYLMIFYLWLPFHDPAMGGTLNLLFSAGLILFFTFMPSITYFARNDNFRAWPRIGVYWGLTYGSQDFVMLKAVVRCLLAYKLRWLPTNGGSERRQIFHFLPEFLFGCLIVLVAALQHPTLLLLPTTILFAGKFLASPFLGRLVFHSAPEAVSVSSDSLIGARE